VRGLILAGSAGALLALLGPAPAWAGNPAAGRSKAAGSCAACHGDDGIAVRPDTPHLAGQPEAYLAQQLKAYRSGKRVHDEMNVAVKGLTDADVADLAAWYASVEVKAAAPAK